MLEGVLANPDDEVARMVFADWCDENGEPERARCIREDYLPCDKPAPDLFQHILRWLEPCLSEIGVDCGVTAEGNRQRYGTRACSWSSGCWMCYWWWRGFPSRIAIPVDFFLGHARIILRHWPIRQVQLRPPSSYRITDFADDSRRSSRIRRLSKWQHYDLSDEYARELLDDRLFNVACRILGCEPSVTSELQCTSDEHRRALVDTSALIWARGESIPGFNVVRASQEVDIESQVRLRESWR